jgi:hypothetical protein
MIPTFFLTTINELILFYYQFIFSMLLVLVVHFHHYQPFTTPLAFVGFFFYFPTFPPLEKKGCPVYIFLSFFFSISDPLYPPYHCKDSNISRYYHPVPFYIQNVHHLI